MKVLLFGATGPTGKLILDNLLQENHEVTCFVRNPDKLTMKHQLLTIVKGSILDQAAIEPALKNQDIVVSALGKKPTITDTSMSGATEKIVRAMEKTGTKRIILISTLGIKETKGMMGLFFTYALQSVLLKNNFAEKARQEDILAKSTIDWMAVRPSVLTNGTKTGNYKTGFQPGEKINPKLSRADLADFIVKNITTTKYSRTAVNISY
ncbi:MAG: NAD-dependent epimerase/dehydratase [Bacteroidetes bacterium]|jgi:putative NADH-flavin reductase|nr:NAD-dependent epimerase/dehydratase [Bacteroidota bacterium]